MQRFVLRDRKAAAKQPTPGRPVAAAPSSVACQMEERFDRLRHLGRGSYGAVWLVRRKADGQLLAMKTVPLPLLASKEEKALAERRQALREVEVLQSLQCPHIVRYAEMMLVPASAEHSHSELHIFTEFCDGGDLDSYLRVRKRGKCMEEAEVWRFSTSVLVGLHELHQHQILHRDLKPANIFLKSCQVVAGKASPPKPSQGLQLRALLGDLGLARTISESQPMASTMVGTPHYCAPEIFEGVPYGEKADIYSFGVCVYELMHGRTPHADVQNIAGLVRRVLRLDLGGSNGQSALEPPKFDTRFSEELRSLVGACLEQSPTARPDTKALLLRVPLEQLAEAAAASTSPFAPPVGKLSTGAVSSFSFKPPRRNIDALPTPPVAECQAPPDMQQTKLPASVSPESTLRPRTVAEPSQSDAAAFSIGTSQEDHAELTKKVSRFGPEVEEQSRVLEPSGDDDAKTEEHEGLEEAAMRAVPNEQEKHDQQGLLRDADDATISASSRFAKIPLAASCCTAQDSEPPHAVGSGASQAPAEACVVAVAPVAAEACRQPINEIEQPRPSTAGSQCSVKRQSSGRGDLMSYVSRAHECYSRWRREGRGNFNCAPGSPPRGQAVRGPAVLGAAANLPCLEVLGTAKVRTPKPLRPVARV